MEGLSWSLLLQMIGVAVIWGVTNPFMSHAGQQALSRSPAPGGRCGQLRDDIWSLVKSWKFVLVFGLNQLGSALFLRALALAPVSVVVPLCNGLTFIVTWVTSWYLGEHVAVSWAQPLGIMFVLLGLYLCLTAS